ncbi:hypothetical protein OGR47_07760 [Methylocystis sp. MJC1]|jgi:plasmid stabilization system protein ParE|uniref:hypothetical protein n=1 Tax=Methylocystis sp. MJC1 TaxID=2654282 RepID=UPI0013ED63DB|nr:hypothetical protein [Methylocystis sp. MJC1]KAF2989362.1 hypothetical protein MJC1_03512 [Methylocystis sp. MJC1]MBU6526887.1 hypothetical protein [Methylocystis sp. MJC1]UZX13323.1 hypothetical protein OGR47_07760 [Methylocystis sp. MJC1]
MRSIRVSRTYLAALHDLLAFGHTRFGRAVVDEKRKRISDVIRNVLAVYPTIGGFDESHGIHFHAVSGTPFVLLYDFDEAELRIHLVIHRRANRSSVDVANIDWR